MLFAFRGLVFFDNYSGVKVVLLECLIFSSAHKLNVLKNELFGGLIGEGLAFGIIPFRESKPAVDIVIGENIEVGIGALFVVNSEAVNGNGMRHAAIISEIVVSGIGRGDEAEPFGVARGVPIKVFNDKLSVPDGSVVESKVGESSAVDMAVFDDRLAVTDKIYTLVTEYRVSDGDIGNSLVSIEAREHAVLKIEILAEVGGEDTPISRILDIDRLANADELNVDRLTEADIV